MQLLVMRALYLIFPIHSQALIAQDVPLTSLSEFLNHTYRHTVGLLCTSDQPVAETSTYTGQHKRQISDPKRTRTGDPSNQAAADLRLRPRGHWDRHSIVIAVSYAVNG
jgi:hypothetical protein